MDRNDNAPATYYNDYYAGGGMPAIPNTEELMAAVLNTTASWKKKEKVKPLSETLKAKTGTILSVCTTLQ